MSVGNCTQITISEDAFDVIFKKEKAPNYHWQKKKKKIL